MVKYTKYGLRKPLKNALSELADTPQVALKHMTWIRLWFPNDVIRFAAEAQPQKWEALKQILTDTRIQ